MRSVLARNEAHSRHAYFPLSVSCYRQQRSEPCPLSCRPCPRTPAWYHRPRANPNRWELRGPQL